MAKKLGKYKVLEEVGRGGMAVVYKARQESLDRIVAIKELDLSRTGSDARAHDRFVLEARAVASLDHPSIVTVHDFWERSGKAFIAMEFVDGLELKELLEKAGALPADLACYVTLQVARALSFAHQQGIIHRDIKPGNIMLSVRGQVKLADFGIALVSGTTDLTTTGQVIGTPAYMSPEQIRGEEMGPGSDIFSLGSVFYETLTGTKPFSGPSDASVIHAIMHKRPVPPRRLIKTVSRRMAGIVKRSLKKKTRKRFQSMGEMATALERALKGRENLYAARLAELVSRQCLAPAELDATVPVTGPVEKSDAGRPWRAIAAAAAAIIAAVLFLWVDDTGRNQPPQGTDGVTVDLSVNAYPWAEVLLDGRSLGYTPSARPFQVATGSHTLELVNPRLGKRTFQLDLKQGDVPSINVDLLEGK